MGENGRQKNRRNKDKNSVFDAKQKKAKSEEQMNSSEQSRQMKSVSESGTQVTATLAVSATVIVVVVCVQTIKQKNSLQDTHTRTNTVGLTEQVALVLLFLPSVVNSKRVVPKERAAGRQH